MANLPPNEAVNLDRPPGFGKVPAGWTLEGWVDYLRHLANVCRDMAPQRAEFYEDWIQAIQDPEDDTE